ncbi:MAG: DUF3109 family protein [Flavobacteriaceae bacterium]|mgnify:FL=1|jgi:Fe-S-cluster containining protein|nr:DUF3109 family protein [Flavobacteriaceae bacterium]MDG2314604.1 DUF3109 family protein [Flavobacteriaceae bacterium]
MFHLGKTIVSEQILEQEFVCNLSACKGACCIEGSAGAPLEEEETTILESQHAAIRPYLRPEGLAAIDAQGTFIKGEDGDWETPLVKDKECAYVTYDSKGVLCCGIEQAYNDKAIDWKKPISCHLYPIRVQKYSEFTAVNYHAWQICDDACSLGASLQVPLYQFVKEALIRKFGSEWYASLEEIAKQHRDS